MELNEARQTLQRVELALSPDGLPNLKLEDLQELYDSLCQARSVFLGHGYTAAQEAETLLQFLRREIEAKRAEERSERHHQQTIHLGGKTLFWAKIGGVAGVIATTATVVLLLKDMPLSKPLPATPSQASPPSSPQASATAAPATAPTATASPSDTPQASETPAVTATPR